MSQLFLSCLKSNQATVRHWEKVGKTGNPGGILRSYPSKQIQAQENQSPPGVKSGKNCEVQHERLLQVYQQQHED